MAAIKKPRILHTSHVDGYRVEWIARRGEYDCNVYDAAGNLIEELGYPKLGPHDSLLLDDFAKEAVGIAKRKAEKEG